MDQVPGADGFRTRRCARRRAPEFLVARAIRPAEPLRAGVAASAVYTLLAVGEGLMVAEPPYLGEWLRNAIACFFVAAIGWIAITSASLMVSMTLGVDLFWPLWILTAVVGIIGLGTAFVVADA